MAIWKTLKPIIDRLDRMNRPAGMTTGIIAIDGCGGSGKSTLADELSSALDHCPIIHTDDFASWDNPLNWQDRMLAQVLRPLSQNHRARYQRYDWGQHALAEWHDVPPQPVVILEGVSALRKAFRPYLSFGIFVSTPQKIRLERGLARDGEGMRDQWLSWMAAEDAYLASDKPQNFADICLDGTKSDIP